MPFNRDEIRVKLSKLAEGGVFVGTSSWKYPGWSGMLYDESRYIYRGKFAVSRFERNCLSEYAETFKTVCVDAAYYAFPSVKYLQGLAEQVPADFRFAFKITDHITIKRFPNLPRFGAKTGMQNPYFLDSDAFERGFLQPCEAIRAKVGILMFEFSRFYPADFEHGRDFVAALDMFFARVPKGWSYGVEMRNANWLTPEYFQCLARHNVTHVYNSWTEMPGIGEQMALPNSVTNSDMIAARFLLKPGRKYEDAVKSFQPYNETKEVNLEARASGAELIKKRRMNKGGKTMVYVNNRLEGNALNTIQAMLEAG